MRTLLILLISFATRIGYLSLATEPVPYDSLTRDWQLNNALSDSPNLAAIGKGSGQRKRSTRGQGGGQGSGEKGRGQGQGQRGAALEADQHQVMQDVAAKHRSAYKC